MENNQLLLDPTQWRRLKQMNKDMKDQFVRMKRAWTDHNPQVDTVDDNCLPEIARIVSETEVEVRDTLKASKGS